MKTATEPEVRVLKVASCPSLSGRSELTYQIGCTPNSEVQLRITLNTGGGMFSNDWVSLSAIQQVLDKIPPKKPLSSVVLGRLFQGKSANTPAFLLAALVHAGLIRASKEKQRSYERVDPKDFMTRAKALIASSVDLKPDQKPKVVNNAKKPKKKPSRLPSKKRGSK
jgi:hypothetical protein